MNSNSHPTGSFGLLAAALNGRHPKLRGGKIPTGTEDWMAKVLVENIEKVLERDPKLPFG